MRRLNIWHAAAASIFLLWAASLALPVVRIDHGFAVEEWMRGGDMLAYGWLGPFALQFGWFANLALWPALFAIASYSGRARRWRPWLGGLLLLLFVNSLFFRAVASDAGWHPVVAYGAGYFAWMAAVAGSGTALILKSRAVRQAQEPL